MKEVSDLRRINEGCETTNKLNKYILSGENKRVIPRLLHISMPADWVCHIRQRP